MRITPKLLSCLMLLVFSVPVYAYIGPGSGLSALGTILAFLGTLLLLFVGFLWYPVKRLIKSRKKQQVNEETNEAENTASKDAD